MAALGFVLAEEVEVVAWDVDALYEGWASKAKDGALDVFQGEDGLCVYNVCECGVGFLLGWDGAGFHGDKVAVEFECTEYVRVGYCLIQDGFKILKAGVVRDLAYGVRFKLTYAGKRCGHVRGDFCHLTG